MRAEHFRSYVPWLSADDLRNDTSQFGEDGLIESILSRIGESNRFCFEAGAADGTLLSNTKRLRDLGWSALLVEADEKYENALINVVQNETDTQVIIDSVMPNNIESMLETSGVPLELDFFSLDIDNHDYWVWHAVQRWRPRVVCIEHSPYMNTESYIPPPNYLASAAPGKRQATLQSIIELGESKGYVPLASTYCNCIFKDGQNGSCN